MELELPPFEEQDYAAVERAVEAYRRGSFTRSEMVEKVRAIVEQYDAISRGLAYSAIEDALGEEMADFWRMKSRPAARSDGRRGLVTTGAALSAKG